MYRERLLETLALTALALTLIWYLYEHIEIEYRAKSPDRYGNIKVITKLKVSSETVSYRLSDLKIELNQTAHTEIVKLDQCRFIDSKNWDCHQYAPNHSEDQLQMLNGTLNKWGTGDMDRYLVLPFVGVVKF